MDTIQFYLLLLILLGETSVIVLIFVSSIRGFYTKTKSIHDILVEYDFYIFEYEQSTLKNLGNALKSMFTSFAKNGYKSQLFNTIQARTLKNKALIVDQEQTDNYPYYQIVFTLKNPKVKFPSFTLSRTPILGELLSVPKVIEERDITKYYSLSTKQRDIVLTKLNLYTLKKYYRNIINQIIFIEHDQKLQITTIKTKSPYTDVKDIIKFIMTLSEELEDNEEYEHPLDQKAKKDSTTLISLPNSIKIYNSISLINVTTLTIKCLICWQKIDYSTKTLLFECCTGYAHLPHGLDWLNDKKKCPKCGKSQPFTIQLPSLSILAHQ